jgi:hypothetical protein
MVGEEPVLEEEDDEEEDDDGEYLPRNPVSITVSILCCSVLTC